uniref:Uncharacterized protein n=1 Tax=Odontella aurita TaxID=265563 RepID=A0A7S4I9U6_9STRA|mmetsp:Transcript_21731/g.63979  ORF Transcript_21731/g.63979 Transcript_21731/m.63979 type:complete len:131 (+) Transcript_21731:535-927(+)
MAVRPLTRTVVTVKKERCCVVWTPSGTRTARCMWPCTLIYPHILSSLERSLEALGFEDDYGDDGNDKEEEKGADDGRDERRAGGQEGVRRSVEALRRLLWKVPSVGKGRGARYLNGVIMEDGPLSPVECN